MAELNSSESIKKNIVMAVRGDMLIYLGLADGGLEETNEIKESFEELLGVPIVVAEIPQDANVKELKENTLILTRTFKHLID